jgi:hypothetical protein
MPRATRGAEAAVKALVVVALLALPAHAEPDLHLRRLPVRNLKMRVAQASAPAPAVTATSPEPVRTDLRTTTATAPVADELAGLRKLDQRVSFSFTTGYQVDGARPSGSRTLDGKTPVVDSDYASLRSYGFGEAFLSTRGVAYSKLETYFALRFQAAQRPTVEIGDDKKQIPSPIATWFERSGGEIRTGWGELRDFLPLEFGKARERTRVRFGDQFIYGPWIVHLDGTYLTYEGPTVTGAFYAGYRHAEYTRDQSPTRPGVIGGSLRFDLRGLVEEVPIAVEGEWLGLSASEETGQDRSSTGKLEIDWRPRTDIAVIAQARLVNGTLANERAEIRVRLARVNNFVFDIMRRFTDDWRWDPSLVQFSDDTTEARRYLDLGPVVPQLIASARAGTVIADNIDLHGRVTIAGDATDPGDPTSSFAAPYLELAGALEGRLRRQVALGVSILSRQNERTLVPEPERIVDDHRFAQPLPTDATLGDLGFTELGVSARMTLGARRFSAQLELYGRNTRLAPIYRDPALVPAETDVRGGGRATLDAWVGQKVRLLAAYDASSALDSSPEITGYKSLRLILTGVY